MAVGFNTPSKLKNETIDKEREARSNQALKAEVIDKVNLTANFIISPEFQTLSPIQKAQVLSDFAHLSRVISSL